MRDLLGILISVLCLAIFAVIAFFLTPVIGGVVVRVLAHAHLPAWLQQDIFGGLIVIATFCVFILALAVFGEVTTPRDMRPVTHGGTGAIAVSMLFLFAWAVVTAIVTVWAFHHLPASHMEEDTLRLVLLAVALPVFSLGLGALVGVAYLAKRRAGRTVPG